MVKQGCAWGRRGQIGEAAEHRITDYRTSLTSLTTQYHPKWRQSNPIHPSTIQQPPNPNASSLLLFPIRRLVLVLEMISRDGSRRRFARLITRRRRRRKFQGVVPRSFPSCRERLEFEETLFILFQDPSTRLTIWTSTTKSSFVMTLNPLFDTH
jgi:hypothetical protein